MFSGKKLFLKKQLKPSKKKLKKVSLTQSKKKQRQKISALHEIYAREEKYWKQNSLEMVKIWTSEQNLFPQIHTK